MSEPFFKDPTLPQPAFLYGDGIMEAAFLGLCDYLWRNPEARTSFEAETDTRPLLVATTPLDRMIDEATGVEHDYVHAFLTWVVETQWGEDGKPVPEDD